MKVYDVEPKVLQFDVSDVASAKVAVEEIFSQYTLPKNKDAQIVIKPNLNNDLNSLTGNSTDLRLIVAVLEGLQKRKYTNIIIADGPNCGITHAGINVFKRLKIDVIAEKYNVKYVDLNKTEGVDVKLSTNTARMAKLVRECDFLINLPKVKTHVEAGMTMSMKNFVGVFQELNKRKIHSNLWENIVLMNQYVRQDLIIVDGFVGMEGNGPGDGMPKKLGYIFAGTSPFVTDLVIARLFGFTPKEVPSLDIAVKKGLISQENVKKVMTQVQPIGSLIKPSRNLFNKIFLRNFFVMPRFWPIFDPLFKPERFMPDLFYKMGVRQDIYLLDDGEVKEIIPKKDFSEKKCVEVCPLALKSPSDPKCIKCMYCVMTQPDKVEVKGNLGFFKMVMRRFSTFTKKF